MKTICITNITNKINPYWVILFLCGLNLVVMHYYFYYAGLIDHFVVYDLPAKVDNILGIVIDIIIIYLLSYLFAWKHQKIAMTIVFLVTLAWSFSNVLYSRFFHQYISLSAIGYGDNLLDKFLIKCIIDGLRCSDLYYIISTCLYCLLITRIKQVYHPIRKIFIILAVAIGFYICTYVAFGLWTPKCKDIDFVLNRIEQRQFSATQRSSDPTNFTYFKGSIRTLTYELFLDDLKGIIKLTPEQQIAIKDEINATINSISCKQHIQYDNIIFIIMESYMSFTSNLETDGKEVTPFLNSLRREPTVYFNGKMKENVTIGESSDGQFIYMTGLLPLRAVITVSKAKNVSLPGLPNMINKKSMMVIPTNTSIWNQTEMCNKYGIDELYSNKDFGIEYNLSDQQLFQLAIVKNKIFHKPFFEVILTLSMHQPYNEMIDSSFPIKDTSLSQECACYLNACHYTDKALKQYFDYLKSNGLYENSLIIITADHPVHNTDLGGVIRDIPLYMINIPNELKKDMWSGECNQLDIYTTLLDLLGIESDWYGLGQSLFSPNYTNVISPRKWDIS